MPPVEDALLEPRLPAQISCSFDQASEFTGLSVGYLRKLAQEGQIRSVKVGDRTLIDYLALRDVILNRPNHVTDPTTSAEMSRRRKVGR